jgi:hypothetical protein
MDSPVPVGFLDIEDWILHYIYHHPKDNHSTPSLLQRLDSVLKAEPSQLDECNRHKGLLGAPKITAEEYESLRNPVLSAVQKAVETLIKDGWAKGKRDTDVRGVVFFSGLDLTGNGTKEAIRRAREKEEKANPPRSFESRLREIRKRAEEKTTKD